MGKRKNQLKGLKQYFKLCKQRDIKEYVFEEIEENLRDEFK